jgi:hypothetical protein
MYYMRMIRPDAIRFANCKEDSSPRLSSDLRRDQNTNFNLKAQPLHDLKLTLVARSAESSAQPIATTNRQVASRAASRQSPMQPRPYPRSPVFGDLLVFDFGHNNTAML